MSRIAIIGSGDLGIQIRKLVVETDNTFVGFFDDYQTDGELIIGKTSEIVKCYNEGLFDEILIGIGYKHMWFRSKLYGDLNGLVPFATLIHPSSYVDINAQIGPGTIIYPGCTIDSGVTLSGNNLLNVGVVLAHDTEIGSNTFISPSVAIAGFVKIGSACIIGLNASIIDNLCIESGTQIGAGTVVIRSIDKPGLYVGNPAKFVR